VIGGRKFFIALGGIVLAMFAGAFLSRQVISRAAPPTVSPRPPVELLAPIAAAPPANPKRLPAGFSPLGDAQLSGKSTLTIKNGTEYDALVKAMMLVDGKPSIVRNFYVPTQSDWTEEKMPPGNYIIRFAQGLDWDAGLRKFNYNPTFGESAPFELAEREWTENVDGRLHRKAIFDQKWITLHKVPHGNFHTETIDEARFSR
jgi:hypothetical protein